MEGRIIYKDRNYKKEEIIKKEYTCPSCKNRDGITALEENPNKFTVRNRYECLKCGTVWEGATYTTGYDKTSAGYFVETRAGWIIKTIIIMMMIFIARLSLLTRLFIWGLNILLVALWIIGRMMELISTGDTKIMNHVRDVSLFTLALTLFI